jgi:hypothetical protein
MGTWKREVNCNIWRIVERYCSQDAKPSPSQCATLLPVPMNVLLVTISGRLSGRRASIALRLAVLIIRPNLGMLVMFELNAHGDIQVVSIVFGNTVAVY